MVGGGVTWESGPAGRGRVTETVVAYAPADGQTVEVADDAMTGRQTVTFAAVGRWGGGDAALSSTALRRRSPVTPIVDALFIRRAMSPSLGRSLARFGVRLRAGTGRPARSQAAGPAGPPAVGQAGQTDNQCQRIRYAYGIVAISSPLTVTPLNVSTPMNPRTVWPRRPLGVNVSVIVPV